MHTLLLHGGGHGAWCWDGVRAELVAQGIASSAFDLPGSGADSTPRADIDLADYVSSVIRHVDDIDDDVTLVAHSIGGMTAPGVAVARPDRITQVVFLAALVTKTGQSGIDSIPEDRRPSYFQMAQESGENSFLPSFEAAWDRFFPSATEAQARRFYARLTPQPLGPYLQPSAAGVDALMDVGVRCSYLLLEHDRTFPPVIAGTFAERAGVEAVVESGDHCWMLTDPRACARGISRIAHLTDRR